MKSLFFIVLGAIPLILLTVSAIGSMLLVRQWKPDITAEHFAKIITVIDTTEKELRPLANAPDILAKDSLLNSPTPQVMRGMSVEATIWNQTPEQSRKWGDFFFSAQRFLETQRMLESKKIPELIALRGDIRSFLNALSGDSEAEQTLVKQIEALQRDVNVKIEKLQKEEEAAQILTDARNAFDSKKWVVCAQFCKQLQDEYDVYLSTSVKANLSMMLNRCAFNLREEGIELILDSPNKQTQKEKLAELFEQVNNPDELNDSQKRKYRQWKEAYDQLEDADSAGKADVVQIDSATRALIQPFYDAPKSFSGRVAAGAKILAANDTPAVRSALKSEVLQLIHKGIPEKTSPEPKYTFQAKLKDGTVLVGTFVGVREKGELIGYKYYDSPEKRLQPHDTDLLYKAEDFSISPGPTTCRRLVNKYNAERKKLFNNIHDPQAWSAFIAQCNELEIRRKTENIQGVSFSGPIKAAEQISSEEVRPQLSEILK